MAITTGTVARIKPYASSGSGGQSGPTVMSIQVAASQTIVPGDILVDSSGKAAVDNTDPTPANILGVAVTGITTGVSPTDADIVTFVPAMRDILFEATLTNDAGNADLTGFTFNTHNIHGFGIDSSNTGGIPVIDSGTAATETALVIGPSPAQLKGLPFKSASTVNPRVVFVFVNSRFITAPA